MVKQQGPFSTLSDHVDYVRSIDYARQKGSLFSVSDDGNLYMWDLNAEKLMQKYAYADEGKSSIRVDMRREESKEEQKGAEQEVLREDSPVVASYLQISERSCCPSAMGSSQQGNMVFVAYTDNTV